MIFVNPDVNSQKLGR